MRGQDERHDLLDARKWEVLAATVSGYIRSALPVGSQSAGRSFGLSYSPATIRNIMSELEALGYLTHPHTSAGRIPTEKGFRYFVDHADFPDEGTDSWESVSRDIEPLLAGAPLSEFGQVVTEVIRRVGEQSGYAGFVVETGNASELVVVAFEACPLSERHALLVVILETGHLLKRTFSYPDGIGWTEFRRIVARMNRIGRGKTLSEFGQVVTEVIRRVGEQSGYAGFVVETGNASELVVVAFEACPLSERHALLVVILETGHLLKRTFSYPDGIGWTEFRRIVARMNRIGRGKTLSELMEALLREREGISLSIESLLSALARAGGSSDVRLFGASRFAKVPEFSNPQELESVFEAFEQQVALVGFFQKISSLATPRRVFVSIGSENELPGLDSCTMVSIPLSRSGSWYGTIGVVGPVRMEYGQVIPLMIRLSERLNLWLASPDGFDGEG